MEDLKKNKICRVVIEGYTSEGLGVAHIDGRAVFVTETVRGDECLIRLVKVPEKGPVYARLETLLSPSPMRQRSGCTSAHICGGCAFQHVRYEEELRLKRERVQDAFQRIAGLALPVETILPAETINGYRNKAQFPVRNIDGRPAFGFFKARSHTLVPIEHCAIQHECANRCAVALRSWMEIHQIPAYDEQTGSGLIRHIFARVGVTSGQVICCIVATKMTLPHASTLIAALRTECPELVGIVVQENTRGDNVILTGKERVLWGVPSIEDVLCGKLFSLSVMSFYQVNHDQAERLYEQAVSLAGLTGCETVLDLYCGTGTLTLCLADRAARVIGVDIADKAIADAKVNAARNQVTNVSFFCEDAALLASRLATQKENVDVVFVDPPRRGLEEPVISIIRDIGPHRVVYVSCDPATLARDLLRFQRVGFHTTQCVCVDMFPRTSHVEVVALLTKADI